MTNGRTTGWESGSHVCMGCVGDSDLKQIIQEEGTVDQCAGCEQHSDGIPLSRLAELIAEIYEEFYIPAEEGFEEVGGSYPEEIVSEMIQDNGIGLPEALVEFLSDSEAYEVVSGGETPFYDATSRYEFNDNVFEPHELTETWQAFSRQVKYEGRFFNPEARRFLDDLIEGLRVVAQERAGTFTRRLEVGTQIYRARSVDTAAEAAKIQREAPIQIGPPPRRERVGGRMNAPGVAVFYGGFSRDGCICEVRPPVGAYVLSAAFEVIRPLQVLDMTAFERPVPLGSMFDPRFRERATYLRFLRHFHREIIRPVLPEGEAIDYVPTQVVAEYLANIVPLDGVIYSSVQSLEEEDQDSRNVALFHADEIVEVQGQEGGRSPALRLVPRSVQSVIVTGMRLEHMPSFLAVDLSEEEE